MVDFPSPGYNRKVLSKTGVSLEQLPASSPTIVPLGSSMRNDPLGFKPPSKHRGLVKIIPLPPTNESAQTPAGKTTFLLERGFVHFHVSWWEGIVYLRIVII